MRSRSLSRPCHHLNRRPTLKDGAWASLVDGVFPPYDADRIRRETTEWRICERDQLAIRAAFELVGCPYPARTRDDAVEAAREVLLRRSLSPDGSHRLDNLSGAYLIELADVDPRMRYMLDARQERTLSGPRSSTEYLVHRMRVAIIVDARRAALRTDQLPEADLIQTLAYAQLLTGDLTPDDDLSEAVLRILAREQQRQPGPDPTEISPMDVRVELRTRSIAELAGMPYPPRSRRDVVSMLRRLDELRLFTARGARVVARIGDIDAAVAAPRLVDYTRRELVHLHRRGSS
jgi:hypothetical protein